MIPYLDSLTGRRVQPPRLTTRIRRTLRRAIKFVVLPTEDRVVLVRAYVSLGQVDFSLRRLGFRRLIEQVGTAEVVASDQVTRSNIQRARLYARWIDVASRHHVIQAHCLHRSLALHQWLRLEHLPSQLRIGVRREGTGISAHAWIELGGEVVNDQAAVVARFAQLSTDRIERWT